VSKQVDFETKLPVVIKNYINMKPETFIESRFQIAHTLSHLDVDLTGVKDIGESGAVFEPPETEFQTYNERLKSLIEALTTLNPDEYGFNSLKERINELKKEIIEIYYTHRRLKRLVVRGEKHLSNWRRFYMEVVKYGGRPREGGGRTRET